MKKAALSELKARLSSYIRLVKSGEQVEIQERGVPVALLSSLQTKKQDLITPPSKDPQKLAQMKFSVRPKNVFDIAINPQDMTNIEQEDEQMARVNELIENIQHDMRKADPEICIHFIKSGETTLPKTYDEETKNATHAQIKQLIDRHYFVHVNEEAH